MTTVRSPDVSPGRATPTFEHLPHRHDPASAGPERRTTGVVAAIVTIGWLLVYAGIRAAVTVIDPDVPLSAVGTDLMLLAGWPGVVVLGVGAAIAVVQAGLPKPVPGSVRWLLITGGAGLSATLFVAAALFLLDLVGGVLPGLGIPFHPYGAALRLGCVVAAGLLAWHTHRFWVATRPAGAGIDPLVATPWWAWVAGYAAALGCLVRLGAQLVVGLDANPLAAGPMMVVFEVGFLLAGLLLPLALVHSWGRSWPFWVPFLAGRRVPRWLLVISGGVLGVGMTAYFGIVLGQMIMERLQGRNPFPPSGGLTLPEPFFWVSIPAYLIWGVGLMVATVSYHRITSPAARAATAGSQSNSTSV
ncbi:hypothetical protein ACQBAU_10735 [Propionibacteriaceae bacterium Y2011]|uniref:hypothetical protein n=1 Tax=Microlunatus sp. Y2014 TaxID=3418488 RepID=UPI003B4406E8